MKARSETPPMWAECLLERLVGADGQSVSGDLREEYAEVMLPQRGRLRADMWYLRQMLSFAPRGLSRQNHARRALVLLSAFTFACGCWLTNMEALLRHPGYLMRVFEDLSIALIGFGTAAVVFLNVGLRVQRCLWACAIVLIAVAAQAFARNARSAHFEGFVLLISIALAVQGSLMLLFLGRTRTRFK